MHRIRLSGFWARTEPSPGQVAHTRHFGAPRLNDLAETVWLVGTAPGDGVVILNGKPMIAVQNGAAFEVDVTASLKPRNVVRIETTGGEAMELALEIRS